LGQRKRYHANERVQAWPGALKASRAPLPLCVQVSASRLLATMQGHSSWVLAASFSPNDAQVRPSNITTQAPHS
jgi:hypothetical protein